MKATYIGKSADKENVYLEYEYRGRRYEVYQNKRKGGEPLRWQHKNNQARIDKLIDVESKRDTSESVQDSLDWFFDNM